ncbi:dTDP-D-glucose 4,6-dehydratase [Aspergillus heteromorphus CBS 117.55]|uniref:dTDP-D-glucose 4,6-dehydratase n=1 Tax=Aspergillus heteromorphus CBS 117.55 TaxID=1448321 RepID=A0A317W379_9EURO|nr:dTDP-D-glucose 4,6-dehydratase [Aspergillus heteromorphus CBS 117.55]PWY79707.1 dTDP-D-glucose 4,6-dehydratase [Aspergillus heteromorphus CBS 117.55]
MTINSTTDLVGTNKNLHHPGVKNILVTGGAGFIGSWMCRHLIRQYGDRYNVVCLDRLSSVSSLNNIKSIQGHPSFHFIKGILNNQEHLVEIMNEYTIDSVIHFAAESSVQKSFSAPLEFIDSNVLGTYHLLEAMRSYGKIVRYVHASTDEVYGETRGVSVDEETRMNPTNPYAASKAAAEMFVLAYQKSFKIPAMILRCNNIYGPCQFPEKLIPLFALLVKDGKKLTMQGDGSRTRNFIYVSDVVDAFDAILHNGIAGSVYNVTSSDEVSVRQVASEILKVYGYDTPGDFDSWVVSMPDRPFNDNDYVVKGDKLRSLEWDQRVFFREGLARTVEWYRENGNDWWKKELSHSTF